MSSRAFGDAAWLFFANEAVAATDDAAKSSSMRACADAVRTNWEAWATAQGPGAALTSLANASRAVAFGVNRGQPQQVANAHKTILDAANAIAAMPDKGAAILRELAAKANGPYAGFVDAMQPPRANTAEAARSLLEALLQRYGSADPSGAASLATQGLVPAAPQIQRPQQQRAPPQQLSRAPIVLQPRPLQPPPATPAYHPLLTSPTAQAPQQQPQASLQTPQVSFAPLVASAAQNAGALADATDLVAAAVAPHLAEAARDADVADVLSNTTPQIFAEAVRRGRRVVKGRNQRAAAKSHLGIYRAAKHSGRVVADAALRCATGTSARERASEQRAAIVDILTQAQKGDVRFVQLAAHVTSLPFEFTTLHKGTLAVAFIKPLDSVAPTGTAQISESQMADEKHMVTVQANRNRLQDEFCIENDDNDLSIMFDMQDDGTTLLRGFNFAEPKISNDFTDQAKGIIARLQASRASTAATRVLVSKGILKHVFVLMRSMPSMQLPSPSPLGAPPRWELYDSNGEQGSWEASWERAAKALKENFDIDVAPRSASCFAPPTSLQGPTENTCWLASTILQLAVLMNPYVQQDVLSELLHAAKERGELDIGRWTTVMLRKFPDMKSIAAADDA